MLSQAPTTTHPGPGHSPSARNPENGSSLYLDTGNTEREKKGYSKYLDDDALGYLHNATKYLDRMSSSNSDKDVDIPDEKKFSQASTVLSIQIQTQIQTQTQNQTQNQTQKQNGYSSYLETSSDVERTPSGHKQTAHVGHTEKTPAKYKDQGYSNYLNDKNSAGYKDQSASDRALNGHKENRSSNGFKENRTASGHADRHVSEGKSANMGHGNGDVYSDRAPQGGRRDDIEDEDLKNRVSYLELENAELRERNEILSGQMAVIKVCECGLVCV